MQKIIELIKREGYVLLVCILGMIGIMEGLRVDAKISSASFLSGPGGYLTIIGISLLLFGFIDIIRQMIIGLSRNKVGKLEGESMAAESQSKTGTGFTFTFDRNKMNPTTKMRLTFTLCVLYVLLIQPLGFTIASLLYLMVNFWLLSNKNKTIAFTIVIMFIILRFGLPAMGLSVPKGLFGI